MTPGSVDMRRVFSISFISYMYRYLLLPSFPAMYHFVAILFYIRRCFSGCHLPTAGICLYEASNTHITFYGSPDNDPPGRTTFSSVNMH